MLRNFRTIAVLQFVKILKILWNLSYKSILLKSRTLIQHLASFSTFCVLRIKIELNISKVDK